MASCNITLIIQNVQMVITKVPVIFSLTFTSSSSDIEAEEDSEEDSEVIYDEVGWFTPCCVLCSALY